MFVNKHFACLKKGKRCFNAKPALYYFLYGEEHDARFSNLHYFTFKDQHYEKKTKDVLSIQTCFKLCHDHIEFLTQDQEKANKKINRKRYQTCFPKDQIKH